MKTTLKKTFKVLGLMLLPVMALSSFEAQAYQDGVLPYSPFMGTFYKQKGDQRCPIGFEIYIKRSLFWDTLVGLQETFGVGFDPRLEYINGKPVVSDASSVGDRTTTFVMTMDTYKVTDNFGRGLSKVIELKKTPISRSSESVDIYVTETLSKVETFTCNYIRYTYQL